MAQAKGIKQVAEKAGVSIATVSKILNPASRANIRVSDKTREKVLKAVADLKYQPSYGAKLLRGDSTKTIGFAISIPGNTVCSYLSSYTFRLLNGIGKSASAAGYQVLLLNGVDYRRFLDIKRLDALLVTSFSLVNNYVYGPMAELYTHLLQRKYPFLVFNEHNKEFPVPYINIDNAAGMEQVADLLKRKGYSNVGFIGELSNNPQFTMLERCKALRAAMKKRGMELNEAATIERSGGDVPDLPQSGRYSHLYGYAALEILRMRKSIPRCIVCGNDALALGVFRRAFELKLRIPEDLALIGFDCEIDSDHWGPGLTTLLQPLENFGQLAVDFVLRKMQEPDATLNLMVQPTLIERGST